MNPYLLEKINFFELDNPLLKFASNATSQCGEDGILNRIFEIVAPQNKYFVEFGAWDGQYLSNCFHLVKTSDWGGCFIEANPDKFKQLLVTHGSNSKIKCVNKFVEFDGEGSLDSILKSIQAPKNLDLLSIDIDGIDYFIWESLVVFEPTIIVIEFNPTIPNDIVFVQQKDARINQGCSLLALIMLGKKKGYELICCTSWNAFFVKKDLFPQFSIPNNFISHMYSPVLDGRIFQGYDSYIYACGMDRLLWRGGIPLVSDDFQVLPEKFRIFPDAQG
jgi:hypothetical protein